MAAPDKSTDGQAESWFSDILGGAETVNEQMQRIRDFAYSSFDRLDCDSNGFISRLELETALADQELPIRESQFLTFLLENHDDIIDAFDEKTIADGISRKDLESYFKLVASLL
jgi:hypothetical protein